MSCQAACIRPNTSISIRPHRCPWQRLQSTQRPCNNGSRSFSNHRIRLSRRHSSTAWQARHTASLHAASPEGAVHMLRPGATTAPPPIEEGDSKGGTSVLQRPPLDLTGEGFAPRAESGFGSIETGGVPPVGGGDWRVLLLNNEKHTEQLCVKVIPVVVSGVSEDQARNCFNTARQLGMAIITSCLKEHAEFYMEQLRKSGLSAKIEPDTPVL